MNEKEGEYNSSLVSIAEVLAGRYRNHQEWEDLKHEGLVAGLESQAKGDEWSKTVGKMRDAMRVYMNIKLRPVSIPSSGAVYALLSDLKSSSSTHPSDRTERALIAALSGSTEVVGDETLGTRESTEDSYERYDTVGYIRNNLWVYLTPKQAVALDLIYFEDYTVGELAQELGVSSGAVSKWKTSGLTKLYRTIVALEEEL